MIVRPCRLYAQAAVATLQVLLVCTRGQRAYTSRELDYIFKGVGTEFFKNMTRLTDYAAQEKFNKQQEDHLRDPERHPSPTQWTRVTTDDRFF